MPTTDILPKQFIETVFEPALEDEIIPMCPIKENGMFWTEPWRGQNVHKSKRTIYFAPYSLKNSAWQEREGKEPKLRRRIHDIHSYYAIVLDDIGHKVQAPDVPPTWRLETSPGNEQWGYLLEEPEEDLARVNGFLEALKGKGISDDGALKLTQVFRLPGSWHYKHKVRAVLNEWEPDRLFTLEGLGESLGVKWSPIPLKTLPVSTPIAEGYQDPVLDWLKDGGRVLRDEGEWLAVECPWGAEHSDDTKAYYSPMGRGAEFASMRTFNCFHEACSNRNTQDFLAWVGEQGGPNTSRTGQLGVAAESVDAFQDLFPVLVREDLPDCRWRQVGENYVPAGVQLATSRNIRWILQALGIEARFNLVMGATELLPPIEMRSGWYAELEDDFERSQAVLDLVLDVCLRLCITAKNDCIDLITRTGRQAPYNPVEEWIQALPWDGQDRLEALLATVTLANPKDRDTAQVYLHRWSKQVMEAIRGYRRRRAKDMVLTFTGPAGLRQNDLDRIAVAGALGQVRRVAAFRRWRSRRSGLGTQGDRGADRGAG